jgi:hypothetical protein
MLTTSNEGFGFLLQVDVANLEKKAHVQAS